MIGWLVVHSQEQQPIRRTCHILWIPNASLLLRERKKCFEEEGKQAGRNRSTQIVELMRHVSHSCEWTWFRVYSERECVQRLVKKSKLFWGFGRGLRFKKSLNDKQSSKDMKPPWKKIGKVKQMQNHWRRNIYRTTTTTTTRDSSKLVTVLTECFRAVGTG